MRLEDFAGPTCPQCGKEMPETRRSNAIYCSQDCNVRSQTAAESVALAEARAGRVCPECGKTFDARRAAWGSVAQASARAAQMAAAARTEGGNRSAPGTFSTPAPGPYGGPSDFPLYNPAPDPADFPTYNPPAVSTGGGSRRSGNSRSGSLDRGNAAEIAAQQRAIRDAVREVAEAQDDLARVNQRVAREFADVFASAITGARSLQDSLGQLASQLGNMLLQRGFEQLLNAGGGGFMSQLGAFFGGARANGGPVSGGRAYLVGERGPELFVPGMNGAVVPNSKVGGSSVNVTYAPTINAPGADANSIAVLRAEMRQQKQEFETTFRDRVIAAVRDPRRRGF